VSNDQRNLSALLLGLWMRLWRWVAVFACARLNARLWDEQSTYVVTQTGEPRNG